jgi:hypothetical protein
VRILWGDRIAHRSSSSSWRCAPRKPLHFSVSKLVVLKTDASAGSSHYQIVSYRRGLNWRRLGKAEEQAVLVVAVEVVALFTKPSVHSDTISHRRR